MSNAATEKAWEQVQKKRAELDDALEAYAAVRAGEQTDGQKAKNLIQSYIKAWAKKYPGQTYVPIWPRDTKAFKRLLQTLTVEEIKVKLGAYLRSDDAFYVNAKHDLSAFPSAINKLTTVAPTLLDTAAAVDCHHKPRCKSDQEHTRRKIQERQ
jgi:hypothetical protein